MLPLNACWSPCMWTNNLKVACVYIANTTIVQSVLLLILIFVEIASGPTDIFTRMFHVNIHIPVEVVGGLMLFYLFLLIVASVLMIVSTKQLNRTLLLPWMVVFGSSILFDLVYGVWLLASSIPNSYIHCLVLWIWMAYSIYLWLVVYSHYMKQSSDTELLFSEDAIITIHH